MIKFSARQRQDSDGKCVQLFVLYPRMRTEGKPELGIQVIFLHLLPVRRIGMFHQQFHRSVAEQPYADVHQEEVCAGQMSQLIERRFLKHKIELVGSFAIRYEYTVTGSQGRIDP